MGHHYVDAITIQAEDKIQENNYTLIFTSSSEARHHIGNREASDRPLCIYEILSDRPRHCRLCRTLLDRVSSALPCRQ